MRFGRFVPALSLVAFFDTMGCASIPELKPSKKPPEAEWSSCVREIPKGKESATAPYPRTQEFSWMSRNEWCGRVKKILNDPARSDAKLAFMGDSLAQGWQRDFLAERFGSFQPIRMGIGGDKAQNLLWRIENGELLGMSLKDLVLLIGTNNLDAGDSPEEVARGIGLVIDKVRLYQPKVRIILMAIFPRGESRTDPLRDKIRETNHLLSDVAKQRKVELIDIGSKLVEKDGSISKEIMGDFVHLTPKGYQIWADGIMSVLTSNHTID